MNDKLENSNFIIIRNFLESVDAIKLAEKFNKFVDKIEAEGDDQVPSSKSYYNYFPFLELLVDKCPEVKNVVKESVFPTYCYARKYLKHSILKSHTDREACEISLTVHLDGDKCWPIYIKDKKNETHSVTLNSGDALLYLGREAEHWRHSYDGEYYTQVFLHYVKSRGDCAFSYFDKSKEDSIDKSFYDFFEESLDTTEELPKSPELIVASGNSKLLDFIQIFDNIVPEDLRRDILEEYNSEDWLNATVGYGEENKDIRSTSNIFISSPEIIEKNYNIRKSIDNRMFESASKVIKLYNNIYKHSRIEKDTGYGLLKYDVGDFYIEHTDSYDKNPRSLTCSFLLNDDFEGGEFCFFSKEYIPKLNAGDALIFPSNFMFPHEITKVTKGTRYSIITWFI